MPPFPFTLIRSHRRKTIALIVQADGTLVVRAPQRAPLRQIEQLVAQKADWVRQKLVYARSHPVAAPHQYASGEKFWFLGREYALEIVGKLTTEALRHRENLIKISESPLVPPARAGVYLSGLHLSDQADGFLMEREALPKAAQVFAAWYRAQARSLIEERVRYFAARCGFSYRKVKITSARTRWGSCSSKGTLCFTWRLVMAPPECIDYVVVHELAHLRVKNHSPAFWREVGAILPDYKARRKWLRVNGRLLTLE